MQSQTGHRWQYIQRMRFERWITKATDTHSEYETLTAFNDDNGYANAPQCYVIHTLPVLFVTGGTSQIHG